MKRLLFVPVLLVAIAGAQAAPGGRDAFAHQAGIALNGAGPFYQMTLPVAVYQGVQRQDLGDLRVFNGQGEAVPHALLRPQATALAQRSETPVPFFPILGTQESSGEFSLEVRRNTDGTLVALRQNAPAPATSFVRGVLFDASRLTQGRRSLRLELGPTATPFHLFTIESSDDLQQWRLLKSNAQVVRLEHDGQKIEQNSVEWSSDAGKYLRIVWANPRQAPAIVAAAVGSTQTDTLRPALLWSDPLAPSQNLKDGYEYALPGRLPLEQLRVALAQSNTLVPLEIQRYIPESARRRHDGGWERIAQAVVYRLATPQGEILSPDVVINGGSESRLRLVIDPRSGGVGSVPPSVQVGFVAQQLVFLPRGDGPFVLAWGAAAVDNTALPITTLVPGYGAGKELQASPAVLQALAPPAVAAPAAAPVAAEVSKEASKGLLWGVLIVGVLVLGGMAWALLRQMRRDDGP